MAMLLRQDATRRILLARSILATNSSTFSTKASFSTSPNSDTKVEATSEPTDTDWFNQTTEVDIDERVVPKPVSWMPDHLPQVRKRQHQKPWWRFRYFVDIHTPESATQPNQEYTEKPEYPPIYDSSKAGIKQQVRLEWYKAIRKLPSADQKIYEITKHYPHLSYMLEPTNKFFNTLAIEQSLTRTHLIHSLPETYQAMDLSLDENLKQAILRTISNRLYSSMSRKASMEFKKSAISQFGFANNSNAVKSAQEEDVLNDVAQVVRSFYAGNSVVLPNVQFDYNAFVASSWWLNDSPIPFIKKKWFPKDKLDQCMVYKGTHAMHMRSEYPLQQVVAMDDEMCTLSPVPKNNYNLLKLGYTLRRHNFMSLPGFWPAKSDGFDFPYLLGHSREYLRLRTDKNPSLEDDQDVLDGMAIMSSFGWLTSLANNLGFTIYDRLTYPLVTQTVITDGQHWSFYVYQLNDHAFHSDVTRETPIPNLCWSSGDLKLFESFENGIFTGVNDDVLKLLVKFLSAPTQTDCNIDLRPYLAVDEREQKDKDYLNYSLRRKFANQFDTFIARRKKVNLWETIYKNHKDAPLDVKRVRPKYEFKYPPFFK